MPLPFLLPLVPVGMVISSVIQARNTNKSIQANKEIAKKQQENQLKLAALTIEAADKRQIDMQVFQERMAYLGFEHQLTIEKARTSFQFKLNELQFGQQQQIQSFIQSINLEINQKNLAFQNFRLEQEQTLQRELAEYHRETLFTKALQQRDIDKETIEYRKIMDEWSLDLRPSEIIQDKHPKNSPLTIIIATPHQHNNFPQIELSLSQGLQVFYEKPPYINQGTHYVEFLGQIWKHNNKRGGKATIKRIFNLLKSEPMLILESEVDGDCFNLRIAYWSGGIDSFSYQTVINKLPYFEVIRSFAKERGVTDVDEFGIIKHNNSDQKKFVDFLVSSNCLLSGLFVDIHYAIRDNKPLQLPTLLASILNDFPSHKIADVLLDWIVNVYQELFNHFQVTYPYLIHDFILQLAQGMESLDNKYFADKLVKSSIINFLKTRNCNDLRLINNDEVMGEILMPTDKFYFDKLKNLKKLISFSDIITKTKINSLLNSWNKFKNRNSIMENRLAHNMLEYSECIKEGTPSTYSLVLNKDLMDKQKMLAKYYIGEPNVRQPTEKVLLVVGAAGAGKTTLINGMINHILGVDWQDKFRFQLITEETKKSQAHSQTQFITAYTIHSMTGSAVSFNLTIIDTPGFGATEGLKRDRQITEQIRQFFSMPNGIKQIDGVGFVAQASLARLTESQKYIFDAILSIFGKDIANNIFMLITFCDGKKPEVLEALREAEIPYVKFFKFNNSALFADNTNDDEMDFDAMFWKMGKKSFQTFFDAFSKIQPQSLQLTKEVLDERKRLEITIIGLEPRINDGLSKLDELRQTEIIIQQREAEIETNKNFKFTIDVPTQKRSKAPNGKYNTTCLQCHITCHHDCAFANDDEKADCVAMNSDGYCNICKCHWSKHSNTDYVFEPTTEKKTKTLKDLQQKYHTAVKGMSKAQSMLSNIKDEFEEVAEDVFIMVIQVQKSLRRLDEIALKADPLTSSEYLELLIESEKLDKKEGWELRVKTYDIFKKQAKLLDIDNNEDLNKILSSRQSKVVLKNTPHENKKKNILRDGLLDYLKFW